MNATLFSHPNDPNPARLVESLRHLGYDDHQAVADILDNSLDANAGTVIVKIQKRKGEISIVIADDGEGMDSDVLDQALRLGSMTEKDPISDLGKFGMGLVTASLSLARRTCVITKQSGQYFTAITDVDEVIRTNSFIKYQNVSTKDEESVLDELLPDADSGTVVLMEKCDGVKNQNVTAFASTLRKRLGRVHRYFIKADKKIIVNDEVVKLIDPLELDDPHVEIFSDDQYPVTIKTDNGDRTEHIRVRISLIPDNPAAGERDVALGIKNQGFYVLRNLREIQSAVTLDAFTKHNNFNRMRGELFLTGDMDHVVGIDFTKRDIVFEQSFKDQLLKHIKGQCTTIKSRESSRTRTTESSEIDDLHKAAERSIDQKSKLLVTPKTEIERRRQRNGSTTTRPDPKGTSLRQNVRQTKAAKANACRFAYHELGVTGQIYECELVGRTIVIKWNTQHPFYQRFVLDQRSDGRLVSAVDFLVYSMASAELIMLHDDDLGLLHNLRSIISSNLRTLLT
jgi:hypothetical protein